MLPARAALIYIRRNSDPTWVRHSLLFRLVKPQPTTSPELHRKTTPADAMDGGGDGEGPVVLITGCSEGGIGNALAQAFAAEKCRVVATSRSLSSMANLEHHSHVVRKELDVQSEDSVGAVTAAVLDDFGRIDVVVNNAGIHCMGPVAEVPLSAVKAAFDTNVYGAVRIIQAVVPHMASRKKGKIVNIGSISALAPGPWAGAYSASKAALHALTDSLRLELRPFGIEVINVAPGAIKTNIGKSGLVQYNKLADWKLYRAYDETMRKRAEVSQDPRCTPADEFAKKAVAAVLKTNSPPWFSYGYLATPMAILYHLPTFIKDGFYQMVMMKKSSSSTDFKHSKF